MAEYIKREDAIKAIDESGRKYGITIPNICNFKEIVKTVPAVEIVRCKDCKYWQDNNGGYPHDDCRWGKDETPDAEDYCSYGEMIDKTECSE